MCVCYRTGKFAKQACVFRTNSLISNDNWKLVNTCNLPFFVVPVYMYYKFIFFLDNCHHLLTFQIPKPKLPSKWEEFAKRKVLTKKASTFELFKCYVNVDIFLSFKRV